MRGKGPLTTAIGVSAGPVPAPPATTTAPTDDHRPVHRHDDNRPRPDDDHLRRDDDDHDHDPQPERSHTAPPRAHRRASRRSRRFTGRPWSARRSRQLRERGRRRAPMPTRGFGARPSGAACVPIGTAMSSTYKLTTDDRGSRIRVTVIARNANGSTSATSAATAGRPRRSGRSEGVRRGARRIVQLRIRSGALALAHRTAVTVKTFEQLEARAPASCRL